MTAIAKVVVDMSLDREFDYVIPAELKASVRVGSRVEVPFGRGRTKGYVVGMADRSERRDLKALSSVIGIRPFIGESVLELARWMAAYYCAPVEQAIRTVLPGAVRRKGRTFKQRKVVELCGDSVEADPTLPPKQKAVLDLLRARGVMSLAELLKEAGVTAAPVQALEKRKLIQVHNEDQRRDPLLAHRAILRSEPLDLMPEQAAALAAIKKCMDEMSRKRSPSKETGPTAPSPLRGEGGGEGGKTGEPTKHPSGVVLLYGVTGSGKTEVYLQAIEHALQRKQGAIVLVPEISLTPQTVERFLSRFGNRIAVLHSHLSEGERHDEWHRVHDGQADIVIGARSAVFAPVRNLGLIVVDEEHEPSYKQEEAPRYSARDVAVMRGRMESCVVVLGSATPALESWRNAADGKYALACLPRRADHRKMPAMRIIDMRQQAATPGQGGVFSKDLLNAIHQRLERAEQTILFLNRRGFSTSLICPKCGYVARCDQCSVTYTYHRKDEHLRCHICGAVRPVPAACPGCHDKAFRFAGVGTQRVEDIAAKCFPKAKIVRIDADVTTHKDVYDRILGDFRVGKTDILIGTQMIAKGLHFPNVTLVGVIYADLSLHMPDFRAAERTFQLLAQVAGRAGRGEVAGEVIVQTYTPFHPAIQAARRLDFEGFYAQEVEFRKELGYPPFAHLVCVGLKGPSLDGVVFHAETLAKKVGAMLSNKVILSAPSPAPLAKAKGLYRYQLMMRCPSTRLMTEPLNEALRDFKARSDIVVTVDVDAVSVL